MFSFKNKSKETHVMQLQAAAAEMQGTWFVFKLGWFDAGFLTLTERETDTPLYIDKRNVTLHRPERVNPMEM